MPRATNIVVSTVSAAPLRGTARTTVIPGPCSEAAGLREVNPSRAMVRKTTVCRRAISARLRELRIAKSATGE